MHLKNKGQALVESLVALPFLISLFSLVSVGLLSLTSQHFIDQWTYEASFCLAAEQSSQTCKNELLNKLSLIPFSHFKIKTFYSDFKKSLVEIIEQSPFYSPRSYQNQLNLPIKSQDFEDSL